MSHQSQQLTISGDKTVEALQEQFSAAFPDLRISFFHHSHQEGLPSEKADEVPPEELVSSIRSRELDGSLALDPSMTVAAFEKMMWDRFGLSIQVFRRSGKQWIQTTITDHWTLAHQDEDGHASVDFDFGRR